MDYVKQKRGKRVSLRKFDRILPRKEKPVNISQGDVKIVNTIYGCSLCI